MGPDRKDELEVHGGARERGADSRLDSGNGMCTGPGDRRKHGMF